VKIPRTLALGGTRYKVKFKSALRSPQDNTKCNGYCDFKNRVVAIDEDLDDNNLEQTFLHEVVHAIIDVWAIDSDIQLDESTVDRLASGFHAFIEQNKGVFKDG
jgi:hypothetical protein